LQFLWKEEALRPVVVSCRKPFCLEASEGRPAARYKFCSFPRVSTTQLQDHPSLYCQSLLQSPTTVPPANQFPSLRHNPPSINMKAVIIAALAAVAAASPWNTWKGCPECPAPVTMPAQTKYMTNYQTEYKTEYQTEYKTEYKTATVTDYVE
jgi:hypothetical protein